MSNQKTPTTILLTPERKFHSFGYAARDFYHDLDPTEAKQWLYLEKFKMKLHTTGVRGPLPRPKLSTGASPGGGMWPSPGPSGLSTREVKVPLAGTHDTFCGIHSAFWCWSRQPGFNCCLWYLQDV